MAEEMVRNNQDKMDSKESALNGKYGYFTPDGKEYVITRWDTPAPWVNVVSNGEYGFVMSQTGGGFSWVRDSKMCRITRWLQDIVTDEWGKYLYIKDEEEGDFWSAAWKPVCADLEKYKVRYGTGYCVFESEYKGISSELTCFVPPKENLEIWKLKLKNGTDKVKKLNVFSYFDWCLGNGEDMHREFQKTFIGTKFDKEKNIFYAAKRKLPVPDFISSGLPEDPGEAFHSVNIKVDSFEGNKAGFIGKYRNASNPLGVETGCLTETTGDWFDSIASLKVNIELKPQEEKTVIFTLGDTTGVDVENLVKKYSKQEDVDTALEETKKFWQDLFKGLEVNTPDVSFNFLTNQWLKYQAISGRMWARTGYYQCSGAYGFRDQLQDSLVFLPIKPELTKKQLLLHASNQFEDGRVYHWFHHTVGMGSKTNMTDDLLWMVFVALEYLKETGDYSLFDQKVKFVDGDPVSFYEHCLRSIDLVLSRFSPRGLPLIGEGDWNDGMSSVGLEWKGESIWLGHFLYGILKEFLRVCDYLKQTDKKEEYNTRADKLKKSINQHAWDGQWYIRATRDNGKPLGSKSSEEAKIFLNAQTWAVINGIAEGERAGQVMDEAEKNLFKDNGPLLFYPAFTNPDKTVGYLSRYAPGIRENGGVYTHAATWAVTAECILKRSDRAYEVYSKLSPIVRSNKNADEYMGEPYATAGNSDGPQSAYYKRGAWTWYSGSGAWLYRVGHEWVLGVRPVWEGLLIDPCIPSSWKEFTITRNYRGSVYNITVKNPEGKSYGIKNLTVNGKKFNSNIMPVSEEKNTYNVEVLIG